MLKVWPGLHSSWVNRPFLVSQVTVCLRLEVLRLNEVKCAGSGDVDHIVVLCLVSLISQRHLLYSLWVSKVCPLTFSFPALVPLESSSIYPSSIFSHSPYLLSPCLPQRWSLVQYILHQSSLILYLYLSTYKKWGKHYFLNNVIPVKWH